MASRLRSTALKMGFAASATTALIMGDPALAQTPGAKTGDLIQEIIVTARKRAEAAQDVPVSINAFSAAQLSALGMTDSRDIGRITPGVQWKGDSPFGGSNIFVRGVGNNTTLFTSSPAVGVYLDETYFNSQAFHGFSTFDVERIEVLKGPQGTLYGRNTTGGTIKYVSNKPEVGGGFNGDVTLNVGNFGLRKAEGGIGADLGEKTAMRLGFLSHDRGGIYYDYSRDTRSTDVDAKALRLQVLTEPTDKLSILLAGSYAESRSDDVRYKRSDTVDPDSITFGPDGPSYSARCANPGTGTAPGCTSLLQLFGVPDDYNTNPFDVQSDLTRGQALERIRTKGGALTIKYDFDFAELTSASSYFELTLAGPQDVDATALNILSIDDTAKVRQASEEIRLTSNTAGPLRWVIGAYYFSENVLQLKPVNIAALGFGFGSTGDQDTDSISLFGETTYSITPAFDISVGLRWSEDKRKVDFTSFYYETDGVTPLYTYYDIVNNAPGIVASSFVETMALSDQEKSWDNVSGRFIANYRFTDDVMAYVSFNRGYKAGEFNFTADTLSSATFVDPETVDAYEIGFKSELFDHKLRANIAAFYYDYKKKQETLFDTGTATLSNADARVKGVDVDITAMPIPGLTLNAGLALLDTEYTDFPNCREDGSNCNGNRLTSSPETTLNLLARYSFDIGGRPASIQADSTYTSDQYFDFRNVSYIAAESYWLVGARASYELTDGLEASLWIQNLTDERYFADGYDVSNFGYSLLLAGIPRTYGASFNYRF